MTTPHEQMREALQKVAALRGNVYESESKGEMQALIDAFIACEKALAAPERELVRLTDMELWRNDELMALNAKFGLLFPDVRRFANAIMDAMIAKNGGK